jgi:hypothetical protein
MHRRAGLITFAPARVAGFLCIAAVASCQEVTITTVGIERLAIEPETVALQVNGTARLSATPLSENGQPLPGRDVAWTSLEESVAVVDGDGLVRAVSAGAATIRATSEGAVAHAQVTVTSAPRRPPGAPGGLSATPASVTSIALDWTASPDPIDRYRIQRRSAIDGAFVVIDSVPAGTTAYTDDGLLPLTAYTYRVQSCGSGGCSGWSNEAAAMTPGLETPGVPSNVSAAVLSSTSVELTWTAPGGQTEYEIRRRAGMGGQWTFETVVPPSESRWVDSGLAPGTYQYQIRACSDSRCSSYSSPVTVNTQGD